MIENNLFPWDIPTVITSRADSRKRVVVPRAKPGEVYAIQETGNGSFILTIVKPAEPPRPKCRVRKESGFTVVVPRQPINEDAIRELMADFP